jgi:hypothetical protein
MTRFAHRPVLTAVVLLAIAAGSSPTAASTGTELFLPAAGTGPGVPPSVWYTTVWIFNPNDVVAQVDLSFLPRNQANDPSALIDTVTVDPGEVVQIDDVVPTLFGVQGFGAIRALSPVPVHVFSRIYSQAAGLDEDESSGQAFPALPAGQALGEGEYADLIGLTKLDGGNYRYNVGFVETTGQEISVRVEAFTSGGNSWISYSIHLLPFEQRQMTIAQLFNNVIGDSDNFRLRVTAGPGDGRVLAFGSRIANGSQDATTFSMVYPPAP